MRLLFLTSRLPFPPNRGDRLRTYHLLRQFSLEHEVTLVSFVGSSEEVRLEQALEGFCEEVKLIVLPKAQSQIAVLANFWRHQPMQALYYRSAKMQRLVDGLLSSGAYDAVYVHLFRMAPYVSGWESLYRIVDLTDMISSEIAASLPHRSRISRMIYRLEQPRIASYEHQVAGWAEETWLISERDQAKLAKGNPSANLQVVPNGVDLERFYPLKEEFHGQRLLFVGHLDVFHNIDAATFLLNDIFPRVRSKFPECRLDIVGPGKGLRASSTGSEQGVFLRGFVPDLNQVLNEATVFVAPLRFSAGVQNKVLEAMAAGVPVVTTGNVNEGLAAQPGQDLLLGESADELAAAISALLEDEPRRQKMGKAGRRFVAERFSWQVAVERLKTIEGQVTSG